MKTLPSIETFHYFGLIPWFDNVSVGQIFFFVVLFVVCIRIRSHIRDSQTVAAQQMESITKGLTLLSKKVETLPNIPEFAQSLERGVLSSLREELVGLRKLADSREVAQRKVNAEIEESLEHVRMTMDGGTCSIVSIEQSLSKLAESSERQIELQMKTQNDQKTIAAVLKEMNGRLEILQRTLDPSCFSAVCASFTSICEDLTKDTKREFKKYSEAIETERKKIAGFLGKLEKDLTLHAEGLTTHCSRIENIVPTLEKQFEVVLSKGEAAVNANAGKVLEATEYKFKECSRIIQQECGKTGHFLDNWGRSLRESTAKVESLVPKLEERLEAAFSAKESAVNQNAEVVFRLTDEFQKTKTDLALKESKLQETRQKLSNVESHVAEQRSDLDKAYRDLQKLRTAYESLLKKIPKEDGSK